jgi:hypothetical protein
MAPPPLGSGRPAEPPSTGSEAVDALVLLLLDIRSQARLSVEDVHERLKTGGQLESRLPARSTLYRKLSGVGLKNERRLIEAVIGVCVSDERSTNALRERAVSLLHQAWSEDAEPVPSRPKVAPDDGGSLAELVRVQRELINVQAQLAVALQTTTEAEKESARSRTLVTTLLMLGALGRTTVSGTSAHVPESPSSAGSEVGPSELRTHLASAEAERDEAHRAAQRRLAEAEDLLPQALRSGRRLVPISSTRSPRPTPPAEPGGQWRTPMPHLSSGKHSRGQCPCWRGRQVGVSRPWSRTPN